MVERMLGALLLLCIFIMLFSIDALTPVGIVSLVNTLDMQ